MSPRMMQQFWALVETIRSTIPLALDDSSLVQWLIRQANLQGAFDSRDVAALSDYIGSRLPLIRELVQDY